MMRYNKKFVYLFVFVVLSLVLSTNFSPNGNMLVNAKSKSDILFLKGKFILRDKKGSIVISDDKKPCHCSHMYR